MIDLIRSLPQGMFWYPLVLLLLAASVRLVLQVRQQSRRSSSGATVGTDPLGSLRRLVARAGNDQYARLELERRLIGTLLQAHGYGGYSVDNCRLMVAETTDPETTNAIEGHLTDSQRGATAGRKVPAGSGERVSYLLVAIERITEEPHGREN